jgi:hypothetical protein
MKDKSQRRLRSSMPFGNGSPDLMCPEGFKESVDRNKEELLWLAEVILGNRLEAASCFAQVIKCAHQGGYFAHDWIDLWVKRCVARVAVDTIGPDIEQIAATCTHHATLEDHPSCRGIANDAAVRSVGPEKISRQSNALERAAFILHGYLGFSVYDCALLIGCPSWLIEPASASVWRQILKEENGAEMAPECLGESKQSGVAA